MIRTTKLPLLLVALATSGYLSGLSPSASAQVTYETRALTGTDGPLGPGLGAGVSFSTLSEYARGLNSAGQTAFVGNLTGPGVTFSNRVGIWSEGGGAGLALVARSRDPAPGMAAGFYFESFGLLVLNDVGQTAFYAIVFDPEPGRHFREGIWSEGGASGLALVAHEGSQAPGTTAGAYFDRLFDPVLNGAGQTAFRSELTTRDFGSPYFDRGIWSEGGGSGLALVAHTGDPVPGTAAGVSFGEFGPPVLNGNGRVAFTGAFGGPGVTSANNWGIFSEAGGSGLALVVRSGSPAPDTADGVNFKSLDFFKVVLNNAGQTAFFAQLTGEGVTSANDRGIWSEGNGSGLALVARTGNQAPGAEPGVAFANFDSHVLNGAGHTAFRSVLTGEGVTTANDRGIWSEGGGSGLALVAREGSQAPGTAAGVSFSALDLPVINGAGQTAFTGTLTGTEVTTANDLGIWASDLNGMAHLIARTGDLFNVSNDPLGSDLRTISDLSLVTNSGGEDGRPRSFNDAGQLVFWASFTDESQGVFVANTLASPATLAGDYNNDGAVDAADYTVWRDNVGAPAGTLPNDIDGGLIGEDQHQTWRENFGAVLPSAALSENVAVPEPNITTIFTMLATSILFRRRDPLRRLDSEHA